MTIDEAIEYQRNMAEKYKYQLVLNETGHPMYSLGDREISRIERYVEEYTQVAEWLEELKIIKEYDLSIPQHFTQEQSKWIKNYCIQKNKGEEGLIKIVDINILGQKFQM